MLPKPLKNNSQSISRQNTACCQLITQIGRCKLIVRTAVRTFHGDAGYGLITLKGNLTRRGNQVKRSGRCLREGGGRESAN